MAVATKDTGQVVQSWVSPTLAREIKQLADDDHRSVSALIRIALEAKVQERRQ